MKRTQLYETHVALGARMVPFAGWEMPVQYDSPLAEHATVRESAGLFDIDHMGQVIVEGPDALNFLQYIVTSDVRDLAEWEAGYSLMCYADGGTVDDIFIYRLPEHYYVVVNAGNRKKDVKWMNAHAVGFDVTITDVSDETYMLAFQGPQAETILQRITDTDLSTIAFHGSRRTTVAGVDTLIGSTGYTGEYGFELFFDAEQAVHVWNAILEAGEPEGAKPIGLAARDSLRFEPCLPLYDHELTADISPLEAGLYFAVKTDKGDYIGRDALLKQRLQKHHRRLACIEMIDKAVPRQGYEVVIEGELGFVTTGMKAPTAGVFVAMALLPRHLYKVGREVDVMIKGKAKRAKIVKRPFYVPAYRR